MFLQSTLKLISFYVKDLVIKVMVIILFALFFSLLVFRVEILSGVIIRCNYQHGVMFENIAMFL